MYEVNIGDNYNTNYGVKQKSHLQNPLIGSVFQPYPIRENKLVKSPAQDLFAPQTSPIRHTHTQPSAPIQDIILASFFPEKLIEKYSNPIFLKKALQTNPNIGKLLKSEGLSGEIEPQNIQAITNSHLIPTKDIALKILKQVKPQHTAQEAQNLMIAALLHDTGKALIPASILDKKSMLTEKEHDIIKLHNELSYEILKTANLNPEILEMVQNHHNYKGKKNSSELTQILKVADMYSALKEERPYKKAFSDEDAITIIENTAKNGEFDTRLVTALKENIKQTTLA